MNSKIGHLELSHIGMDFPTPNGPFCALDNVDLHVAKGEFISLIGHSGCGKSTILNILAGLDTASTGALVMDGHEISGPGLDRGVVFQRYSVFPHLTVLGNTLFGIECGRAPLAGRLFGAARRAFARDKVSLLPHTARVSFFVFRP